MKIANFLKESFIDYPGKVSSVIFVPECNYRCPACHAKNILNGNSQIKESDFFEYLDSREKWIEAVVLCGGEPTLEKGIEDFAIKIKERGLAVKLDTNGSNPEILNNLRDKRIIDYVAMDVKAPPEFYLTTAGRLVILGDIERSIEITASFPKYEFRTTLCPIYRGGSAAGFMDAENIEAIANWILKITGRNEHKYFLQKFVPRKGELIDSELEKFPETPEILIKEALERVSKLLPQTRIRE